MGKIWRLEDIDPDNPEERFLPALQSIPIGFGSDAAGKNRIIWPEPIARAISKHLTEAGVPPIDPETATIEYRPPYRGEQSRFNGMGGWVPKGSDPAPDPVVIQDPASMTVRERDAVVERLRYQGYRINEPEPKAPTAQVVDTLDEPPRFDPAGHTVSEVNAYLRGIDDRIEYGRVLHAERNGQARNGILKRNKGV
ncbi:DUF2744 domain-containing protein [Nocardia sp. NPDC050712]|uniref:phage gene 29 protein family protein n=1 Tax=Nocardia sp. NPDC050712 TaxID=3155518 RepID=UPI0033C7C6E0